VKNHGIPEHTIEAVISASGLFFSLPEEAKLKVLAVFIFLRLVMFGVLLIRIVLF
jgi:isopenicillin N synthase-like dioxygenase